MVSMLAYLAAPTLARAQTSPEIAWQAPPGCPSPQQVRAAIDRWLASSPETVDARAVRIEAQVTPDADGFALDLTLTSQSGVSRERLRAQRCDTLLDVVALKVSLAASPPGSTTDTLPPARPRIEDPGASAPADVPAAGPVAPPLDSALFALRVTGGAAFGALPGIAAALGLSGGLQWDVLRIELGVAYGLPRELRYRERPNTGAQFQLLSGLAQLCATLGPRIVEIPLCAVVELGVLHGRSVGTAPADNGTPMWGAAGIATGIRLAVAGPLWAALELHALAAFTRAHFRLSNMPELFSSSPLAGRILAAAELRF